MLAQRLVGVFLAGILGSVLSLDLTITPGANGAVIVDAVVDRIRSNCIFGNDRLFLRRLAYVETSNGEDPQTYRFGYNGGIWQIDEAVFNATNICSSPITSTCNVIQSSFGIDWRMVTWFDLRKPLYSALAATLLIKLHSTSPPDNIAQQASFWKQHMRTGGNESIFTEKASNLAGTDCRTELDLAFILDGSGSVSYSDFQLMLGFVQNVVDKLDVAEDEVKVAAVEFASVVGMIIPFKNFTTKETLINTIGHIPKSGGSTNTAAAINTITSHVFSETEGSRPNAKHVTILVTDGRSNVKGQTIMAAENAKAQGIVMVSVGVGNIDRDELEAVASAPNCTHVFILDTFMEIDSLVYQLKETSCAAPKVLVSGTHSSDTTVTKPVSSGRNFSGTYKFPHGNVTGIDGAQMQTVVRSTVHCATLDLYASYMTSRPGPAFYDYKDRAIDGRSVVLYPKSAVEGRSLYVTVVGLAKNTSCLNSSYTLTVKIERKGARVVCLVEDTERECTREDFKSSPYSDMMCDDSALQIDNPCTVGKVSTHPHPSDLTKFIRCSSRGKMYVTQCPEQEIYNGNTHSCGNELVKVGNVTPLPETLTKTCSPTRLEKSKFYFPYPGDKSKYVQCDVWGRAWVKPCPSGLEWSEAYLTCSYP